MNENEDKTQEAARSATAEAEGRSKITSIEKGRINEPLSEVANTKSAPSRYQLGAPA